MPTINVLIVEDSPTQRYYLASLIGNAPGFRVVGQARDGIEAIELTEALHPQVICMDIHMPRLDGLEATRQIMRQWPTPIVVVSHAASEADLAMQAMQAGALAAIEKPPATTHPDYARRVDELLAMLRLMSGVRVIRRLGTGQLPPLPGQPALVKDSSKRDTDPVPPALLRQLVEMDDLRAPEIVVIGASAGGPGTLARMLGALPPDFNLPILIVQHLSSDFMPGLADWLRRVARLPVRLAIQGETPQPGVILIAPGGFHMMLSEDRRVVLDSETGSYRHQPAVDALFHSVAQRYGSRAIGAVLTGMGEDGAAGLRAMRDAGARTIAQDESTCVVFGMPAACIALGAAEFVLPLDKITSAIVALSRRREGRSYDTTNRIAR